MFASRANLGGICSKSMGKGLEVWECVGESPFSQQAFIQYLLCASQCVSHEAPSNIFSLGLAEDLRLFVSSTGSQT